MKSAPLFRSISEGRGVLRAPDARSIRRCDFEKMEVARRVFMCQIEIAALIHRCGFGKMAVVWRAFCALDRMSGRVIQRYGFGKMRLFGVPLYTWDVTGVNSIQRFRLG